MPPYHGGIPGGVQGRLPTYHGSIPGVYRVYIRYYGGIPRVYRVYMPTIPTMVLPGYTPPTMVHLPGYTTVHSRPGYCLHVSGPLSAVSGSEALGSKRRISLGESLPES